jgi:hypothetical protein
MRSGLEGNEAKHLCVLLGRADGRGKIVTRGVRGMRERGAKF